MYLYAEYLSVEMVRKQSAFFESVWRVMRLRGGRISCPLILRFNHQMSGSKSTGELL